MKKKSITLRQLNSTASRNNCLSLTLLLTLSYSQSVLAEGGGLVTDDPDS